MKILFSNLPWWTQEDGKLRQGIRAGSRWPFTKGAAHVPGEFKFGGYLPFPYFLSNSAALTQKLLPDSSVTVRDSVARGETYTDFGLYLQQNTPDWIVIETASPSWEHDQMVLERIIKPLGIKVILCGTLPESQHWEILEKYPFVHAILRGEYDKPVAKAIKNGRGVYEHELLTLAEMNSAPYPMWDESCLGNYWDACPQGQKAPQLQMWTSRGCPFKCVFCVWPATMTGNDPEGNKPRSVRFYSAAWVEGYILEMLNRFPYQSIYFDDDTFNLSDKHVLEICEVMKQIGIPWSAMCRADTIKPETWIAMKESGCFGVKIGFESGSQYVIDHIVNKRLNIMQAKKACFWLQDELGMKVHTTWTIGLPGETKEQQAETLKMIDDMYQFKCHTTHQLSGTATVDGTPLDAISKGAHLEKYDAATNEGFFATPDGQLKIERMK